ncbi:NAD(P)H-dependent oxidoreductase [Sulfurimonas sp. HSL-1716]|uniref:NADPH-dependent FMN reductase n=1 Tax=Hydrocurvibacter sulfurireducens TaxID=3131937 RepID=UPI0031F85589
MKTLILLASSGENLKLALRLQEQAATLDAEAEIVNIMKLKLPLYDMDVEINEGIPQKVYALMEKMKEVDSYIVVAPTYNGSIPPVLSNAVAWISRADADFRVLFNERIILMCSHSNSDCSGVFLAMRQQFNKLGSIVLSREIGTTLTKELNERSSLKTLKQFFKFSKVNQRLE